MTHDTLIPPYLRIKQDQAESADAHRQAAADRQRTDELLISAQSEKFWRRLTEKLRLAIDSLAGLPALKLDGRFSSFKPSQVRLEMHRIGGRRPSSTHTDLYYDHDGRVIRCTTLGDGVYNLSFCLVSDTEIGAVSSPGRTTPMDAEQSSEYVIKRMMELIEREAN